MKRGLLKAGFLASVCLIGQTAAWAGQAPGAASDPDVPVSHHDRVYSAEQFSNTVSVTDPLENRLLGVIRLGDPQPRNFSPLYKGQVLVHGMGFSPDHKTLAVVSIGSNPSPSSIPRPTRRSTPPMSAARRMRRFSRLMARRSGSSTLPARSARLCMARTISSDDIW
jgi:hypothetical protein